MRRNANRPGGVRVDEWGKGEVQDNPSATNNTGGLANKRDQGEGTTKGEVLPRGEEVRRRAGRSDKGVIEFPVALQGERAK